MYVVDCVHGLLFSTYVDVCLYKKCGEIRGVAYTNIYMYLRKMDVAGSVGMEVYIYIPSVELVTYQITSKDWT